MKRDPVALYRARLLAAGIAEAALARSRPSRWRGSTRRPKRRRLAHAALESAMTDVWADGANAWRNMSLQDAVAAARAGDERDERVVLFGEDTAAAGGVFKTTVASSRNSDPGA